MATFDSDAARKAGYSDAEINDHMGQSLGFDVAGARKAGYSDADIAGQLRTPRKPAPGVSESFGMGALRGAKDVIDTGAQLLATGFDKIAGTSEGQRVADMNAAGKKEFDAQYGKDNTAASLGRVGGQIVATLPVGGALGAGVKAAGVAGILPKAAIPLGEAIATGGMRSGPLAADASLVARAADMGVRMAGGAIAGGASAALVDPDSAALGAGIGAALPPSLAAAGKVGRVVGSAVAPFTQGGKDKIAGSVLRQFATDPDAAQTALRAAPEVVPGSAPSTAAAAGDVGLAGLQRTVINRNPVLAAELAERATAQNEARTRAIEAIAGNRGKIAAAEEARNLATGAMREAALDRAGDVPAKTLIGGINSLLADPNNAGLLAQRALRQFRGQIVGASKNDAINARALYAIRKDINDALGGKLQGESGNLKNARSQLIGLKDMIDESIEAASNRVAPSAERGIASAGERGMAPRQAGTASADNVTGAQPAASWREYLRQYSEQSVPIDQMKALEDVMKRVQTGAMDTRGNLVMSSAKLNNILKNEGDDLARTLTPEQLQTLRNVQADLNASTLASTAGKAVGSNTVQNLGSDRFLSEVAGKRLAGSGLAQDTLGRVAGFAAKRSNAAIEDRLGEAMLDPGTAALLMELAKRPDLLQRLGQSQGASLAARAAPVLLSNGQR
ncbi:hypothetical protein AcdelDRAFT_0892 [Acidovorax delafieldii 2AN]|uniref:Uncharacterized protein n=1 Tax=Acidovorax delafieldii 2AN TaxID=573060 RepID=C5T1W2_ACIDE|nr:hypothetical protein [Acidovorax delafieldii]EER61557.1 hypothetical protein AcdelDRAFT_0892 [Acidovorax delafieldii 2AN]